MPVRLCSEPGCGELQAYRGRCEDHARETNRVTHRNRTIYNSKRWQILRRHVLHEEPICQSCDVALSTDVDHITPIEQGGPVWERANLSALCHACHARKTRAEQQGWAA